MSISTKTTILLLAFMCTLSLSAQKTTGTVFSLGNIFNFIVNGGELNWNNQNTWSNGRPANGDTVIITLPVRYNENSPLVLGNLIIAANLNIGSSRTLKTKFLELYADINVTGVFALQADQVGEGRIRAVNGGTITGNFESQYIFDRCNNWSVYGSPFDVTFAQYADSSGGNMVYSGFPGSDYPTFNYINAYLTDEDWTNGFDGYLVPSSVNQVIPRGQGFWYWNSDTVFNSVNPNYSISQQWKVSTSGTLDFSQNFNFNISYTNNGNIDSDGWNLISNPYPGTINWDAAGWNSSNITGEIHYFNTCNQAYSSYVGGVGVNGGTGLVSPYQGFYVKANGNNPSLSCDASVIAADYVQLRNEPTNVLKIAFQHDEVAIRLDANADTTFNNFMDASKFFNNSTLYSTANLNSDHEFAINALADEDTVVVPVFVKGGNDTLHFSNMSSFSNYRIYVDDLEEIDFSDDPLQANRLSYWPEITANNNSYVLDSSTNDFEHRINVWFIKKQQDFTNNNEIYNAELDYKLITLDESLIFELNKPATEHLDVEVFDISGRVIEKTSLEKGSKTCKVNRPQQVKIIKISGNTYQQVIKAF